MSFIALMVMTSLVPAIANDWVSLDATILGQHYVEDNYNNRYFSKIEAWKNLSTHEVRIKVDFSANQYLKNRASTFWRVNLYDAEGVCKFHFLAPVKLEKSGKRYKTRYTDYRDVFQAIYRLDEVVLLTLSHDLEIINLDADGSGKNHDSCKDIIDIDEIMGTW